LSWSHYRTLTTVEHPAERAFYEIEAELQDWSVPHLARQIHTRLFARLLKSRDKQGVMDLATRGQVLEKPADMIKHPVVLDFLDLPESAVLCESARDARRRVGTGRPTDAQASQQAPPEEPTMSTVPSCRRRRLELVNASWAEVEQVGGRHAFDTRACDCWQSGVDDAQTPGGPVPTSRHTPTQANSQMQ
jgi:hypothetical protein